jgi:hypothetical protein
VNTVIYAVTAIGIIILLWIFLLCCTISVHNRSKWQKTRDVHWSSPFKKLSWFLQDLIPERKTQTGLIIYFISLFILCYFMLF